MKYLPFILIVTLFIACSENKSNIEKYTSIEGKFKITFPGTPTVESSSVPSDAGNIEVKQFSYQKSPTEIYVLVYSDYPPDLVKANDPDVLLQNAKGGLATSDNTKIESDEKITIDGHPGYYFKVIKDTYHMCCKIFFKENRLYQLLISCDGDYPNKESVEEYMNSFELIK